MERLIRYALGFCAALILVLGTAHGAENNISLLPGIDLPGYDYQIIEDTSLDACREACTGDRICRAFTYNESAEWCFLKSAAGEHAPFEGATSGMVDVAPYDEIYNARLAELPIPPYGLVESAEALAADMTLTDPPPPGISYADLVAAGDEAVAQSNPASAIVSYRFALAINFHDPALWQKLADASLARARQEAEQGYSTYDFAVTATSAALNAFLRSEEVPERAAALAALAEAFKFREMWREAIATYRGSLALVDNAELQASLDQVVAEHGFRITSNAVDAETATPRICAVFSETLPASDLSEYVVVEDVPQAAIETEQSQICITGVEHGRRYHITVRAGLPSAEGETLLNNVDLNVFVPDRTPFVGFANNAYVMPSVLGGGLPITSVNAETADVAIYRIGDRSIATAVRNGIFQRTLDGYSAEDVANSYGEKLWEGQLDLVQGAANELTTTAVPVSDVLGDIQPGAYVITAKVTNSRQEYWQAMATQWFIVTDLGITAVSGEDGVHAFVRSLASAEPVANAHVRLVAVNNEILDEAQTDAEGRVTFAPGLARGEGGRAPQLVIAETDGGDYAFLDVFKPAFDLTDRGVEGRPSPGPLDLFATTERGVYRPGETVFVTALLRDTHATAVTGLPLTMEVERPDGVVAEREVLNDGGAGGYFTSVPLVPEAMRGSWQVRFYAEPDAPALTSVTFLVEDFEPERLAFEISANEGPVTIGEVTPVDIAARYLYGATAPGLFVQADAVLRPTTTLAGHPGYTFGRHDDPFQTYYEPLGSVGYTDDNGNAVAEITIPTPQPTTRPLEAQIFLQLIDTSGRPVSRSLTRPVLADVDRIGVRPVYDEGDGFREGGEALFDVIAVAPRGETIDKAGLSWTVSRIETDYQWYRENDTWKWEAITTTREVSSGTVDALASGPVQVSAPIQWGRYLIEVESGGENPTSTSYEFYAGYYYIEAGSDTPDTLDVALDKTAYRAGETATLKLEPQFAGTAVVMVVDDRVIDMQAVEVPAEGTSVTLPVTDDWGPGAYVTAVLYRPSSPEERRMPSRALGVAYADVDPGDRLLDVSIEAAQETLPRQSFTATVRLGNAAPGEQAYVAVAAVDLGILNLTNFAVPDPDGWYFGQRQLGVEFHDLYGNLIDPTQGEMGALRAGGDGGGSRLGAPPPTSVLMAQHSGIVTVGEDGTASVTFDLPDFAGTARLMAIAWTADAVGHDSADVIVRDPVVVTVSPPRFLRIADTSRLLVEVNNVNGPAGAYTVELATGEGITTDAAEQTIELAQGARTSLNLALTGAQMGDHELRLIVTDPEGRAYVKALTLGVRAASAPTTASRLIPLGPGETITLDGSDFAGMLPATGMLTLAVGPVARLDVPGLLLSLDRYPYGCAEQVSSRALPLLYLNEVAEMIEMGTDEALDQRIRDAIADLLSKQNSSGSFGLWDAYSSNDLWLDAYVTDFLLRAKAAGFEVPEQALSRALDSLGNQVSYATDFERGGEGIAYALYDLSRAGRATIGDLRYYFEARLQNFGSALAQAQIGAALALYGDRTRSAEAFAAAVQSLRATEPRSRYREDYGSKLRDMAGVLALAAEFAPAGVDLSALTSELADARDAARYTSTQEDAWTLLAAAALAREAGSGVVTIDGEELTGSAYRRYQQEHFDGGSVTITNTGNTPTEVKVTATAIPEEPPAASSNGLTIERAYYLPDGTPFDPALTPIRQNDRFVVVLTMSAREIGSGHQLVADPLPAGFEIENPSLGSSPGTVDLSWLTTLSYPVHVESRTDQFVAAFRYVSEVEAFSTAYLVRAVSPGTFVLPGATIEDMYRPELRANTDAGSIEVLASGP